MPPERAILFIDGSNFYHGANRLGVATGDLDYQALARKLILNRELAGIRYYVGKVSASLPRIASQSKFLRDLREQGVNVSLGRIERKLIQPNKNPAIVELEKLIAASKQDIEAAFLGELQTLCKTKFPQYTEKRVDVSIAVDMVTMAQANDYDVAYLLSADGDFVPAVNAVKALGKNVFAASPASGLELAKVVDAFIPLQREWFFGLRADTYQATH